jgi:hypothetical protein
MWVAYLLGKRWDRQGPIGCSSLTLEHEENQKNKLKLIIFCTIHQILLGSENQGE